MIPKYSNLTKIEQIWLQTRHEKLSEKGPEEKEQKYYSLTEAIFSGLGLNSIENENTQFVRYLHLKGIDEKRNLYLTTSGSELSDGKKLDADEAKKFNENLPDFFSEEYDAKN